MIKTLFASACVLACCMGNDYPANAYGGYNSGECDRICRDYEAMERREDQRQIDQRLDRIESDARWSSY